MNDKQKTYVKQLFSSTAERIKNIRADKTLANLLVQMTPEDPPTFLMRELTLAESKLRVLRAQLNEWQQRQNTRYFEELEQNEEFQKLLAEEALLGEGPVASDWEMSDDEYDFKVIDSTMEYEDENSAPQSKNSENQTATTSSGNEHQSDSTDAAAGRVSASWDEYDDVSDDGEFS